MNFTPRGFEAFREIFGVAPEAEATAPPAQLGVKAKAPPPAKPAKVEAAPAPKPETASAPAAGGAYLLQIGAYKQPDPALLRRSA